ncbi:TOBE domain-containing protein [Halobellus rarus]|uniref:TOBE domain-containing protein n=1 Tax=Halobellus rarus TaxID=1126237 RepID=A0ABD6CMA6_9EURY|nr:TOBE domain-containing protein [Halobellus rarus]
MGSIQPQGEPFIEADGVRVDARDVEALRGVDEYGSMYRAAEELGRSYARIQRRVSELEETFGPLLTRQRGGTGGGGSTLTANARDLLGRFDRLRAEFSGLARTEESVFSGTLVDRDGLLGTVETPAGTIRAIVAGAGSEGDATAEAGDDTESPDDTNEIVQVSVRSDAVVLTTPEEAPKPSETSVRNRFAGTVESVESEGGIARVTVDVGVDAPLRALLTETSRETLALEPGETVVASFKATAARGVLAPEHGGSVGSESAEVDTTEKGTSEDTTGNDTSEE